MHVAHLITRSDIIGGASIHVRDLAAGMQARGVRTTVIVGGDGPYIADLRAHGLDVWPVPALRRRLDVRADAVAYRLVRSTIAMLAPDIVAGHTSKGGALARIACRSLGIPATYTPHAWPFDRGVPGGELRAYRFAERMLGHLPGTIVNVSQYERDLAVAAGIGRPEHHVVIHNGMAGVPESLRAKPTLSPPMIVMTARFEGQKDHRTLVEALARVRDLEWHARLVGHGSLETATRARARELGLADRVTFLGPRADVPQLLSEAQLFVLATNWESLPLSIIEAMRAGLPVVATAVGGIPELVVSGVTGYTVPRSNAGALAGKLRLLLTDGRARAEMGNAGFHRFEEELTEERMLDRTLALYEVLVAGARRPPARPRASASNRRP